MLLEKQEKVKYMKKKLNHRIIHIMVVNPENNKIYLQKRSENKSFLPGYYCSSAGGHVSSGEKYEEAAKRELYEEIGIDKEIENIGDIIFESNNHKRYIRLFICYEKEGFEFNDGEVASGEFFSIEKVKELIEKNEKIHPQLKFCFEWMIKQQIRFIK